MNTGEIKEIVEIVVSVATLGLALWHELRAAKEKTLAL